MNISRIIISAFIAVLTILTTAGPIYAKKKTDTGAVNSDELKADYIYMEALRRHSADKEDAYYELLQRAHELNPDETDIEFYLGFYTALMAQNDTLMGKKGYDMMKRHFDKSPADSSNNVISAPSTTSSATTARPSACGAPSTPSIPTR